MNSNLQRLLNKYFVGKDLAIAQRLYRDFDYDGLYELISSESIKIINTIDQVDGELFTELSDKMVLLDLIKVELDGLLLDGDIF